MNSTRMQLAIWMNYLDYVNETSMADETTIDNVDETWYEWWSISFTICSISQTTSMLSNSMHDGQWISIINFIHVIKYLMTFHQCVGCINVVNLWIAFIYVKLNLHGQNYTYVILSSMQPNSLLIQKLYTIVLWPLDTCLSINLAILRIPFWQMIYYQIFHQILYFPSEK